MQTLIIFDIDGTLLFSNKADSEIFAKAFRTCFGFSVRSIDWSDYPHVTDTTILSAMFEMEGLPFPAEAELENFKDHYVRLLEEGRELNPEGFMEVKGARSLIEKLVNDGRFLVGIATGGFRKPAFVKLKHVGINTDSLFMSFADGHDTREQIIGGVLRQISDAGHRPTRTIYVGDAEWDVRTTRNLQMPFIGIKPNGQHEELIRAGARHVINHYLDLEHFLSLIELAEPPGVGVGE